MRTTQWKEYERQLASGKVKVRTVLLALEEQLRNQADLARKPEAVDQAALTELAETMVHAANTLGMHALSHSMDEETDISELQNTVTALA